MKYFSMYSGVGGFELGIQKATQSLGWIQSTDKERQSCRCDKNQRRMQDDWKCIGYSEIDKYATAVYKYNFGEEVRNYEDATKINTDELPDFDMLVGGFPCQAFSIAGNRRGFDDTRGTLFFEIARIAKVKKPKIMLLENVKGLLNHDEGKTFRVIIQTLDELGYNTQWLVLNSRFHGVPQNRERVFFIASLRGESRPEILPFGRVNGEDNAESELCDRQQLLQGNESGAIQEESEETDSNRAVMFDVYNKRLRNESPSLTDPCHNSIRLLELTKDTPDAQRVYDINGIAKTLKGEGGGQGAKTGLYMIGELQQTCLKRMHDTPVEVNIILRANKKDFTNIQLANLLECSINLLIEYL